MNTKGLRKDPATFCIECEIFWGTTVLWMWLAGTDIEPFEICPKVN